MRSQCECPLRLPFDSKTICTQRAHGFSQGCSHVCVYTYTYRTLEASPKTTTGAVKELGGFFEVVATDGQAPHCLCDLARAVVASHWHQMHNISLQRLFHRRTRDEKAHKLSLNKIIMQ